MKKVKLLLTMAVVVFATTICCSMSAFALTDGDWEFQLLDNEVTITGYIGKGGDVVIPDTIFGATVTKVEYKSHAVDLSEATSVTFPKTVKAINSGFGSSLETVILPEGVESLEYECFKGCENLKNITLPSTLKKIDSFAFSECKSLEKLNFPAGLESIGAWAFDKSGILEIDLSKNNVNIADHAFACAENLRSIKFPETITEIPESVCIFCSSLADIYIPGGVEKIDYDAFRGCSSLESIILPASLKSIGDIAFDVCTALKEVVIPYGVTYIGSAAFRECKSLKSLYIPDTVKEMSDSIYESENAIIYCTQDSYAAKYCKENSISYLTDNSVNSGITVLYNGTRISFHSYGQNPELLNSRTLVPLRSIFEAMGAEVQWDNTTSTAVAKRDGVEIKIQIGANEMYKDGKAIAVDVPAMLLNDRTMVPVRVIAEAFGADVQWNGNGRTVLITE